MMQLSIVIPVRNRLDFLKNTLLSLNQQSLSPAEFEVIVVDDCSDQPVNGLLEFGEYDYRLIVLQTDFPGGSAARARNQGAAIAKGPLLLFLDSDVVLSPGALQVHTETHSANDNPKAVLGKVLYYETEDQLLAFKSTMAWDFSSVERLLTSAQFESISDRREKMLRRSGVSFGELARPWLFFFTDQVSIGRKEFWEVHGFDEFFDGKGAEDTDLGYRLQRYGIELTFCPTALGFHQLHSRAYELEAQRDRRHECYFLKKFPTPEIEDLVTHDYIVCALGGELLEEINDIVLPANLETENLSDLKRWLVTPSIIVGAPPIRFLESIPPQTILERNRRIWRYRGQEGKTKHSYLPLLGTATPFPNLRFDTAVVTPIWQVLPKYLAARLFQEQCRIAKSVIVVRTGPHQPANLGDWWRQLSRFGKPYWSRFYRMAEDFSDFTYHPLNRAEGSVQSPLFIAIQPRPWLQSFSDSQQRSNTK